MSMEKGFIIKLVAGDYSVICNHQIFLCKARGLFRNQNQSPMVGDEVLFTYDKTTNHGVIHQILPRKNQLLRPPVANIDIALIVMSTIEPSFDAYLVDKLIVQIEMANITPILCISKCEHMNQELQNLIANYQQAGYQVIPFSAHKQIHIDKIKEVIQDQKVVLCGQSAVGKSSLINVLAQEQKKEIGNFSAKLGRGKHQTREVEFLQIENAFIADTPGFSRLELNIDPASLARIFKDFDLYAKDCKYNTCLHKDEPQCGVKKAVQEGKIHPQRYKNYLQLLQEVKEGKKVWRKK